MSFQTSSYFTELQNYSISKNRIFELIALQPVNIGNLEFPQLQQECTIAIGAYAGFYQQGTCAIAVGEYAGYTNQGEDALAIGSMAGQSDQSERAVAIGFNSGNNAQGVAAISIGDYAAFDDQGSYSIAIGSGAGYSSQSNHAIAIGCSAGVDSQDQNSIAIGTQAGYDHQKSCAIAIGAYSGSTSQGEYSICIGYKSQSTYSNSVVLNASGETFSSTASGGTFIKPMRELDENISTSFLTLYDPISKEIMVSSFSPSTIVGMGYIPGDPFSYSEYLFFDGSTWAVGRENVHLGRNAGRNSQGSKAVALGYYAGYLNQGQYAIAIGSEAGKTNQGEYSIAIGSQSISTYANSIVLNASGSTLASQSSDGFFVKPIAAQSVSSDTFILQYQSSSGEISYSNIATNSILYMDLQLDPTLSYSDYLFWDGATWARGRSEVHIGSNAGFTNQGSNAVALGNMAGFTNQGVNSIAIGIEAGKIDQGANSIAIGKQATCTYANSTVINASGITLAASSANALFIKPIRTEGSSYTGNYLLQYNPTTYELSATDIDCTTVAKTADLTFPPGTTFSDYLFWNGSAWAVGSTTVHIGSNSGFTGQSLGAIAIGTNAGYTGQQSDAIAIGSDAGKTNQASNSICIGKSTICTYSNSIVINASGVETSASTASGFFVNPVRQISDNTSTYLLQYNTSTFELSASQIPLTLSSTLTSPRAYVTFTVGSSAISTTPYSFNVSSVQYISLGKFRVNFTTALPNANYVVVLSCSGGRVGSEGGVAATAGSSSNLPQTTYCPITVSYYSGAFNTPMYYDPPRICALFF